jgi:arylsulfatase A-like enzyme
MDSLRPPAVEMTDTPDSAHPDGFITETGLKELNNFKKSGEPFFLALGYYRPHLPFTPPKKYWDLYERDEISPAENPYLPKNRIGYHDWNELRRYGDIPREGPVSEAKARELKHGYYASVSFIDAQVGRVMAELEKLELDENTIVVFWGDHCWNLEEHGLWCKHTNYEISTRTAMMIKVPELTDGSKTEALAGLIDIYPTLCHLAGLPVPKTVEGKNLVPVINGEKEKVQNEVFSFYGNSYSMRTDRYRFTKYFEAQKLKNTGGVEKSGIYELYDHQTDPDENFNIAYEPENSELVKKLEKRMYEKGYLKF